MTSDPGISQEQLRAAGARWAGMASVSLAGLAIAAVVIGWGANAAAAKKAVVVATPLWLVALFLGAAGWGHWTGKVGAGVSGTWLLATAALFGWIALTA